MRYLVIISVINSALERTSSSLVISRPRMEVIVCWLEKCEKQKFISETETWYTSISLLKIPISLPFTSCFFMYSMLGDFSLANSPSGIDIPLFKFSHINMRTKLGLFFKYSKEISIIFLMASRGDRSSTMNCLSHWASFSYTRSRTLVYRFSLLSKCA